MTDYIVARLTLKGTPTIDVLVDAAPSWRKHYPEGAVVVELAPGEAREVDLNEIVRRINGQPASLQAAVDAWRAHAKATPR